MAFQRRKPEAFGVKAPLPGFLEPALASSIAKVPSGSRWIHEIKFDGYRVQIHLANEAVKIFTRRGHDWTHRFTTRYHKRIFAFFDICRTRSRAAIFSSLMPG